MAKVIHYREECIGCGVCVLVAEEHWKMNGEDGRVDLIRGKEEKGIYKKEISESDVKDNEEAAMQCPVNAIKTEK